MRRSLYLFMLTAYLFFVKGNNVIPLHGETGEVFSSPNYPEVYPNNLNQWYYIKGRKGRIIILTFLDFETEGLSNGANTDYLRVFDGKRNEETPSEILQGTLSTPFTVVSTINRMWLRMISNERNSFRGFQATYSLLDTKKYCKISSLSKHDTVVRSCTAYVHGYAKQCAIERGNYQYEVNCASGTFEVANSTKSLIVQTVELCEDAYLDRAICPYEEAEIFEFYENHQLPTIEVSLTTEEQETVEQLKNETNAGIGKGARCPKIICLQRRRTRRYVAPSKCGSLPTFQEKRRCLQCRIYFCRFVPQYFG